MLADGPAIGGKPLPVWPAPIAQTINRTRTFCMCQPALASSRAWLTLTSHAALVQRGRLVKYPAAGHLVADTAGT